MNAPLSIEQAIRGFTLHIEARRLSPGTIRQYLHVLNGFASHIGAQVPLLSITLEQLEGYFVSRNGLKRATLKRHHTALSSFSTWASTRHPPLVAEHMMRNVKAPRPEENVVVPFTKEEIKALLNHCSKSAAYTRPGKRECEHTLPDGIRNRSIILLLLDTGLRASELCSLAIEDVDLRQQRLVVVGKGNKERELRFDARTAEAIWKYLATRSEPRQHDPLFANSNGDYIERRSLCNSLRSLGNRADIKGVHTHRFRHTFAIEYLRNHGDIYTLQMMLGHTSLEMVRRYLNLAQSDLEKAHKRASPVANWRL